MDLAITKSGRWLNWSWVHWLIVCVVFVIAVKEVYERQMQRLSALDRSDVEVIESNIQEYNSMAERLAQLEVLPPVKEQWRYLPAIANRYGVELSVLNGQLKTMYDGPLVAWNAELKGRVGSVLVTALEIQQTVPTYLYQMRIKNGEASVGLSIIGSE